MSLTFVANERTFVANECIGGDPENSDLAVVSGSKSHGVSI